MQKSPKNTSFSVNRQIDCKGRPLDLSQPAIMGILNVTPDSFYDGALFEKESDMLRQAEKMMKEGADIIDIGAMSTRPGADEAPESEERSRLMRAVLALRKNFPEAILSIDTYHANLAEECISAGAHMVNDISGGQFDENMFDVVSRLGVPYVMMHIQGTPRNMQQDPQYADVVVDVKNYFQNRIKKLASLEFSNIILDPGFGFGKTVNHNYQLLKNLKEYTALGFPVLAGVSRKSMINKVLRTKPENALNGTTVVNTLALLNGANLLRVHDVKEARQAIELVNKYNEQPG